MDGEGRIALSRACSPRPAARSGSSSEVEIAIATTPAVLSVGATGRRPSPRTVVTGDEGQGRGHALPPRGCLDLARRRLAQRWPRATSAAMGAEPWWLRALRSCFRARFGDEALDPAGKEQAAASRRWATRPPGTATWRAGLRSLIATTVLGRYAIVRGRARAGARPGSRQALAAPSASRARGLLALERAQGRSAPRRGDRGAAARLALVRGEGLAMASGRQRRDRRLPTASARDAGHLADAGGVQLAIDASALDETDGRWATLGRAPRPGGAGPASAVSARTTRLVTGARAPFPGFGLPSEGAIRAGPDSAHRGRGSGRSNPAASITRGAGALTPRRAVTAGRRPGA